MKSSALLRQRGMTLLLVLILMTVMLLGGLGLARITEAGGLITGNVAARDGSLHAAEVGWNTAFQDVITTIQPAPQVAIANWYWPTTQATDAAGIPVVNFDNARLVAGNVGRYEVRYVVDRLCNTAVITSVEVDCLSRRKEPPRDMNSVSSGDLAPSLAPQYRITIRVTDQRGTQTWTQALVN